MKFDENRKLVPTRIKGCDYLTYEVPTAGGKRKRIYGKTIEELRKKVEDYTPPAVDDDIDFIRCIEYFIRMGKVTKKEAEGYRKLAEILPDTMKHTAVKNLTQCELMTLLNQSTPEQKREWQVFLGRFITFTNKENITSLDESVFCPKLTSSDYLIIKNAAYDRLVQFLRSDSADPAAFQKECCLYFICIMGLSSSEALNLTRADITFANNRYYFKLKGRDGLVSVPLYAEKFVKALLKQEGDFIFGKCSRMNMGAIYRQYANLLHIEDITGTSLRSAYIIFLLQHNVTIQKTAALLGMTAAYIADAYGDYAETHLNDNDKIADLVAGAV